MSEEKMDTPNSVNGDPANVDSMHVNNSLSESEEQDGQPPVSKKQRTQSPPIDETAAGNATQSAPSAAAASASSAAAVSSSATPAPLFVAIMGGGLSGLSCALSLQRVGIDCRVFERDTSFAVRKQGFGLTLTNSNVGALAQLGVIDECIQQDCPSTCHYVFDKYGNVLGYYGRAFLTEEELKAKQQRESDNDAVTVLNQAASAAGSTVSASAAAPVAAAVASLPSTPALTVTPLLSYDGSENAQNNLPLPSPSPEPSSSLLAPSPSPSPPPGRWWSSANLRIPREDLRKLLFSRLKPDTVQWGARLLDYTEHADGVDLSFADGSHVRCSILVGADGINSIVRRLQDEKCKEKIGALRYIGVSAIVGLSPYMHPLLDARGFYGNVTTLHIHVVFIP
jgi:hypothetical protein